MMRFFMLFFCWTALLLPARAAGRLSGPQRDSLWLRWSDTQLPDSARLEALHHFTYRGILFADPDSGRVLSYQALHYAEKADLPKARSNALHLIGLSFHVQGQFDSARFHYRKALDIRREIGHQKGLATSFNNLGVVFDQQGQQDSALKYYRQALQRHRRLGNEEGIADACGNLGIIYHDRGKIARALELHSQSLRIRRRVQDSVGMAKALNNIGNVFMRIGSYDSALVYQQRSMAIKARLAPPLVQATTLGNLGNVYERMDRFAEALSSYRRAEKLYRQLDDQVGLALTFMALGVVHEARGDYDSAQFYQFSSLEKLNALGSTKQREMVLANLASVHFKLDAYATAIQYGKQALELARDRGNTYATQLAAGALHQSLEATGQYQKALDMLQLSMAMRDSLRQEENQKEAYRYQYRIQYEKKALADSIGFAKEKQIAALQLEKKQAELERQQIALAGGGSGLVLLSSMALFLVRTNRREKATNQRLASQKAEIERQNEQLGQQQIEITAQRDHLTDLNQMKDRLFSILGHDLRTPLGLLRQLLSLFADPAQLQNPGALKKHLRTVNLSLNNVSGMLDNVFHWARHQLQEGNMQLHPKPVQAASLVHGLTVVYGQLARIKGVRLESRIDPETPEVWADPDALQLVMRNLLSNALKFTPEGGSIYLEASDEGNRVLLSVNDTGIGMDETTRKAIFGNYVESQRGTEQEKGTGLGLMLCRDFVHRSGGRIGVESTLGEGSRFWVQLPVAALNMAHA